jgi:hypothetical protein
MNITSLDAISALGALEGYPLELIPYKQWLLFDLVWDNKKKKYNKPPKKVMNGQLIGASKVNSNDMMTFKEARAHVDNGIGKGLGFCITPNDPFICLDLDKCIREPWCAEIITYFESASELSVSKTGAHIFIKAVKPDGMGTKRKDFYSSQVELLGNGTFVALTGSYNGLPIRDRQDRLVVFGNPLIAPDKPLTNKLPIVKGLISGNAQAVIHRLENDAKHRHRFNSLFSGNGLSEDKSTDDLSLCNIIFAAVGDNPQLIDEVFRSSNRIRDKWDEKRGRETYGEITINKAVNNPSPLTLSMTAVEAFRGMPVLDSNCEKTKKSTKQPGLKLMSLRGHSKEMESKMLKDKFVLQDLAILGQMTVFYAPPNAGKTLITLHLLAESIKAGNIDPDEIYYINADDNYRGLVTKLKFAEKHGFHMLAPNQNGFETNDLLDKLSEMVSNDQAHGRIIILDTLKKFTDLMHKTKSSDFSKKVREFVQKGGTVISLAHTNKRADENGKLIHAGTSDIKDDSDCTYTINIMTDNNESYRVVEFENTKQRGSVANSISFRYSKEDGIKYYDLLDSIEKLDDEKIQLAEKQSSINKNQKLINVTLKMIRDGFSKKTDLIHSVHCAVKPEYSKKDVANTLDDFEGDDFNRGARWSLIKGDKNVHLYSVLEPNLPSFTQCVENI